MVQYLIWCTHSRNLSMCSIELWRNFLKIFTAEAGANEKQPAAAFIQA